MRRSRRQLERSPPVCPWSAFSLLSISMTTMTMTVTGNVDRYSFGVVVVVACDEVGRTMAAPSLPIHHQLSSCFSSSSFSCCDGDRDGPFVGDPWSSPTCSCWGSYLRRHRRHRGRRANLPVRDDPPRRGRRWWIPCPPSTRWSIPRQCPTSGWVDTGDCFGDDNHKRACSQKKNDWMACAVMVVTASSW